MRYLSQEKRESVASAYREGEAMVEIAFRFGVTIRTVRNIARAAGLPPRGNKPVERVCRNCGKTFPIRPSRAVRALEVHCGWECYRERIKSKDFQSRQMASAKLRRLIWSFFPIEEGHKIHHLDGNMENNDLSNIAVFRRPGDVESWRQGKAEPLWRGDR